MTCSILKWAVSEVQKRTYRPELALPTTASAVPMSFWRDGFIGGGKRRDARISVTRSGWVAVEKPIRFAVTTRVGAVFVGNMIVFR